MESLLKYLQMESTWRGLILLATAAGAAINPEQAKTIIECGIGLVGMILTLRNK